jgi:hypothetical protein
VSNLKGSFKKPPDKILTWTAMNSRQTAEWRTFFFVKTCFSPIKSPNSSRKSIKKNFWESRNQYFILTSFIGSKNCNTFSLETLTLEEKFDKKPKIWKNDTHSVRIAWSLLPMNGVNMKLLISWFPKKKINDFLNELALFIGEKQVFTKKMSVTLPSAVNSWLSKWEFCPAVFWKILSS